LNYEYLYLTGVIFALKVLVSHYNSENRSYILGFIPVSSKIVFWAELVIIQLITPNASFTGIYTGVGQFIQYHVHPIPPQYHYNTYLT